MRAIGTLLLSLLCFSSFTACSGNSEEGATDEHTSVEIDLGNSIETSENDDNGVSDDGREQPQKIIEHRPSEGSWYYRETPTGAVAMFGEAETEPMFAVRCDDRTLHFDRAGTIESGDRVEMTIYTSEGNTRIEASAAGIEIPFVRASLPAGDSWTQRLADAEGRIAIAINGGEPLVMPHSDDLTRLIRECSRLRAGVENGAG